MIQLFDRITISITWYISFLISIVLHEYIHGLLALKFGDKKALQLRLITINPIPHIKREIIGTIFLPIISLILLGAITGWASTPFSYSWAKKNPKYFAITTIAGPLVNLMLLLFTMLIIHFGFKLGIFYAPDTINYSRITITKEFPILGLFFSTFFTINLVILFINIIPLPPFDGASIYLFFLGRKNKWKYFNIIIEKKYSFLGVAVAFILLYLLFDELFVRVVSIIYPGFYYSWK
ncbi:site-2 protease family protein [Calditrichota bacterium LG25]